jgi:hypothetical protein
MIEIKHLRFASAAAPRRSTSSLGGRCIPRIPKDHGSPSGTPPLRPRRAALPAVRLESRALVTGGSAGGQELPPGCWESWENSGHSIRRGSY